MIKIDSVSNHQPPECLLSRLIRRRSKKTSKLRVTGLSAGNSPETGEFPAQMASNAENVSIWWRHLLHDMTRSQMTNRKTIFAHRASVWLRSCDDVTISYTMPLMTSHWNYQLWRGHMTKNMTNSLNMDFIYGDFTTGRVSNLIPTNPTWQSERGLYNVYMQYIHIIN